MYVVFKLKETWENRKVSSMDHIKELPKKCRLKELIFNHSFGILFSMDHMNGNTFMHTLCKSLIWFIIVFFGWV